jgi:GNAT superfamily N-acetyltransferase
MTGGMAVDCAAGKRAVTRPALRRIVGILQYGLVRIRTRLLLSAELTQLTRVEPTIPVRYRFGDASDLGRVSAMYPDYESSKGDARRGLVRGDWLILGEHKGEVIFVGWVLLGAIKTGRGRIRRVSPTWAYTYKTYTAESCRSQGVAARFYEFVGSKLAAQGYTRLVCWISDRNVASLRAHARAGFAQIGILYELRLIRWYTYWESRRVRRFLRRRQ